MSAFSEHVREQREFILSAADDGVWNEKTALDAMPRTAAYFAVSFAAHVERARGEAGNAAGIEAALAAWISGGSHDWSALAPRVAHCGGRRGEILPIADDTEAMLLAFELISRRAAERGIVAGMNLSREAETIPDALKVSDLKIGEDRDGSRQWTAIAWRRFDVCARLTREILAAIKATRHGDLA